MIKNILNFKVLFILILFMGVMSCEKEDAIVGDLSEEINVDDIDMRDLTEEIAEVDFESNFDSNPERPFDGKRCFTLVFPVTIEFPDGTTLVVEDKDAMLLAFKTWKENNPDVDGRPVIQFPYDVTLQDESVVTFNSKEDISAVLKDCFGDRKDNPRFAKCYTLVFPVTIVFPDGTTLEVDSRETMGAVMMKWKENNPDVDERPELQFPLKVKLKDGSFVKVNSKEELGKIARGCEKDRKQKPNFNICFKVVFPVTIEFPDGTTKEIGSKEDMQTLLIEWKENNADVDGRPHIMFPFDVEIFNGDIITINSKEDLVRLLRKCNPKGKKGKKGKRGGK